MNKHQKFFILFWLKRQFSQLYCLICFWPRSVITFTIWAMNRFPCYSQSCKCSIYISFQRCQKIESTWKKTTLFALRLPFNDNTPLGYSIALAFSAASILAVGLMVMPFPCIIIGFCQLIISFVNDCITDFRILNKLCRKSNKNPTTKIQKLFCEIVRNFADAKELSAYHLFYTEIWHLSK